MNLPLIFTYYFLWHYTSAFRSIFVIWGNFLWFFYNFFSIGLLLRTLFSPWRRLGEAYKKAGGGIDPAQIFSALLVNTLMRFLGAIIRLIFIALGLTVVLFVFLGGLFFFVLWVFLPLVIFLLLLTGIFKLFI